MITASDFHHHAYRLAEHETAISDLAQVFNWYLSAKDGHGPQSFAFQQGQLENAIRRVLGLPQETYPSLADANMD